MRRLEKLAKEYERMQGYSQVRTPHLTKESLYQKTGHLPYYAESMYPAMDIDGTKYYIKPMNCPHHHKLFKALPRSYRDLPIKFSEYGTCYRYEKSGQLFGLMRVRSLQMNDAHIYCTKEQFKFEFLQVCKLYLEYFRIFGIKKYKMRLSLHDKSGLGEKYVNEPELWISTENLVREAMIDGNIEFDEVEGEAAFYGPKIDVQIWSAIGREFTLATNQVDFAIPKRLKMKYINEVGNNETPLCIHRAPLGTHERFIGFLIEHFGGNFPLWLAPIQVIVIPISENNLNYAMEISKNLFNIGIRSEVNKRSDKIGAKIRQAELEKVNIMLIVGDKEEVDYSVSVRKRFVGNLGVKPFDVVKKDILDEIKIGAFLISKKNKSRINEDITAEKVRLISETGEQIGIVNIEDALNKAKSIGLDLIEIAPEAKPPVCKILDHGKLKYEKKEKAQNKKKQHVIKLKEIRLRPRIEEHDLMTKLNQGRKFLEDGCKLKVTLMFRGRRVS